MHNKHEDGKHEEQQARAHENSKHDNINLESSSHENSKHENIKHIEHENSNYENRKLKHNQSESLTESTRPAPRNLISPIRVTHLDQRDHPTQLNQHNQSHANQSAKPCNSRGRSRFFAPATFATRTVCCSVLSAQIRFEKKNFWLNSVPLGSFFT